MHQSGYANEDTHAAAAEFDNDAVLNSEAHSRARYAGAVSESREEFREILGDELREVAEDNRDAFMYSREEYIDLSEVDWEEIAATYEDDYYEDGE